MARSISPFLFFVVAGVACRESVNDSTTGSTTHTTGTGANASSTSATTSSAGGSTASAGGSGGATSSSGQGGGPNCGTPSECAAIWEQNTSDHLDELLLGDRTALYPFLTAVPKGGDLHNHLTGAVYAETYLDWAQQDGDCINSSTLAVVFAGQCSASTQPVPTSGAFYDSIVRAWSMKDFVPGAESGHDHFFATFGKYGAVAGAHRNDDLADIAKRAASENQLYIETMFNLGKNVGSLSASLWSGTLTAANLPTLYASIMNDPTFAAELAQDVAVVTQAHSQYLGTLGCSGASPPPACKVEVRFVAQVARTGANDNIFGELVSAFEMAKQTNFIVAANLSSPEDDTSSLNNYGLHMAMLDFLHQQYNVTGDSPLHITLHAGELSPAFLPPGSMANTFHIRQAVEIGHAERIGHGLDVLSETDAQGLLDEMQQQNVLVEVCMSSNAQILEISGAAHPLSAYLANGVPVALATDDQGVSRSSMAGEYFRAVTDQSIDYRTLKTMARQSLEHAFLPGASLWAQIAPADPVVDCQPTATMGVGDPANATCQAFLDTSEKARLQWELEHRFRLFESQY